MSAMVLLSSLAGCGGEGVAGGSAPHPNRDTTYQTLSAVDTDNTPSSHNVINASISVNTNEAPRPTGTETQAERAAARRASEI